MKASFILREDGGAAVEKALANPALRSLTLDFHGATDPEIYRSMAMWLARLPWTDLEELVAISASFEHPARRVEIAASSPPDVRPQESVVAVLGDYVALGLGTAGLPSTLRSFAIRHGGLTSAGVTQLVPALPSALTALSFRENRLDVSAVDALLATLPPSVVELDLGSNPLADTGAAAFAASSRSSGFSQLLLDDASIGDAGARAIARSPALERLSRLDLSRNPIGDLAAKSLTDRFGSRVSLERRA